MLRTLLASVFVLFLFFCVQLFNYCRLRSSPVFPSSNDQFEITCEDDGFYFVDVTRSLRLEAIDAFRSSPDAPWQRCPVSARIAERQWWQDLVQDGQPLPSGCHAQGVLPHYHGACGWLGGWGCWRDPNGQTWAVRCDPS